MGDDLVPVKGFVVGDDQDGVGGRDAVGGQGDGRDFGAARGAGLGDVRVGGFDVGAGEGQAVDQVERG